MALGFTQPVKEMSTRILPDGKVLLAGRPASKARLNPACESIFQKVWGPRRLTTIWASTTCYRDSFTYRPLIENFPEFFPNFTKCIAFSTNFRFYFVIVIYLEYRGAVVAPLLWYSGGPGLRWFFRGFSAFHHEDSWIWCKFFLSAASHFLASLTLRTWRWRRCYVNCLASGMNPVCKF
jgi:hypothetical protein